MFSVIAITSSAEVPVRETEPLGIVVLVIYPGECGAMATMEVTVKVIGAAVVTPHISPGGGDVAGPIGATPGVPSYVELRERHSVWFS